MNFMKGAVKIWGLDSLLIGQSLWHEFKCRESVSLLFVLVCRFGEMKEVEIKERNWVTLSDVNKMNHRIIEWLGLE